MVGDPEAAGVDAGRPVPRPRDEAVREAIQQRSRLKIRSPSIERTGCEPEHLLPPMAPILSEQRPHPMLNLCPSDCASKLIELTRTCKPLKQLRELFLKFLAEASGCSIRHCIGRSRHARYPEILAQMPALEGKQVEYDQTRLTAKCNAIFSLLGRAESATVRFCIVGAGRSAANRTKADSCTANGLEDGY